MTLAAIYIHTHHCNPVVLRTQQLIPIYAQQDYGLFLGSLKKIPKPFAKGNTPSQHNGCTMQQTVFAHVHTGVLIKGMRKTQHWYTLGVYTAPGTILCNMKPTGESECSELTLA